jgi:hypothetical protein
MIRGTYRNKGWCPTVKKLGADLGFLDLTERNFQGVTYAQALREMINSQVYHSSRTAAAFMTNGAALSCAHGY